MEVVNQDGSRAGPEGCSLRVASSHLTPSLSAVLQVRSTELLPRCWTFGRCSCLCNERDTRFALHSFQELANIFHISLSWMCESLFKFDELSNANKGHIRLFQMCTHQRT